jgi:hypothetical protein
MWILAIDPGPTRSAWVEYQDGRPVGFATAPNANVLHVIDNSPASVLAVEMIASYGMAVGAEVFETAVWAGRFIQRWLDGRHAWDEDDIVRFVYRRDVKLHLCGQSRAKDANVRQALIDRYGPGRELAIGRKASPGPLHGVSGDVWAALGVAVTVGDSIAAKLPA